MDKKDFNSEFGQYLRKVREHLAISQSELARMCLKTGNTSTFLKKEVLPPQFILCTLSAKNCK